MAITVTDRGFTQSTPGVNATTTLASGSFSPTGGRVLVVSAYIDDVTGPSFDGDSITISDSFTGTSAWTTGVYKHQLGAGADYCVAAGIYVATLGASPGTGTVTATFNRPNGSEDNWKTLQVYELAGASGSVGASGSTLNRPAGAGTISVTLSGAPASDSFIVGHCNNGSQITAAIVEPSGWTEQQDTAAPSSWGDESEDAYLNGGGITTFSWSGLITTDTAMAIAVEIKAPTVPAGVLDRRQLRPPGRVSPVGRRVPIGDPGAQTPATTGTVAVTLADFTGAASGSETFTGTSAQTLANFTGATTGTVANPVTGTVAVTLASFVGAGASTQSITGTVAVTLANAASAVTAVETFTGTVARTLADFTGAATGTEKVTGTVARTLANFTGAASGTVTYTASSSGLWPTTVSANGRYIKDQNGDPWMMHGDAAWDLAVNLTFAEMQTYLSDRDTKGFNLVLVEAPEHLFAPSAPANVNGDLPFTGTAFQSSLNEAYWRHVDAAVGLAASKGITILFACSYLGFSGTEEGWDTEVAAASNAQVQSYGAALGARYKDLPNIIWVAGADQTPSATLLDRLDHIVTGIQGTGDVHLWTAHNVVNHDAEETWGGYPWLDLNSVYASDPNIISEAAVSYGKATVRPTFHIEGKYFNFSGIALAQIRRQAWQAVLVGAIGGQIVGNEGIWSFGFNTGFSTNGYAWATRISDQESSDASVMAAFIDGLGGANWSALIPDLTDIFLTSGEGTGTTQAAASYSNDWGLVYLPAARSITVDLSKLVGHARALVRWFDPTNGSYTSVGTLTTASQVVTHPGNNAAGDADWVLVAEGTQDASGTVAVTLAPVVGSASGLVKVTGTAARTLANFTGAASGTVANPVTGTVARTLAAFVGSAASTEAMIGTVGRTLADLTGASSGTVANPITGTAGPTLANVTGDALGTIGGGTNGIAQPTLGNATSAASGTVTITGTIAAQLENASAGIAGVETITGSVASTLASFTGTAAATEGVIGASARTLADFAGAALGNEIVNIFGTAAADLGNFVAHAFSTPTNVRPAPGDQYAELTIDDAYRGVTAIWA